MKFIAATWKTPIGQIFSAINIIILFSLRGRLLPKLIYWLHQRHLMGLSYLKTLTGCSIRPSIWWDIHIQNPQFTRSLRSTFECNIHRKILTVDQSEKGKKNPHFVDPYFLCFAYICHKNWGLTKGGDMAYLQNNCAMALSPKWTKQLPTILLEIGRNFLELLQSF